MIKKYVGSGLIAAGLLFSFMFSAAPAHAAALTEAQIQAILSLLTSFGADSAVVANVNATLHGQASNPTSPTPPPLYPSCSGLTRDLYIGKDDASTNGEVSQLQQFLIREGVYPEARVTGYYGTLTAQAVVRWQKAHGMDFVTPTSGVGTMTRSKMRERCGSPNTRVEKVNWIIEMTDPTIMDANDPKKYQQTITAEITFADTSTKRYSVGTAYGCTDSKVVATQGSKKTLGHVNCYMAASGTGFIAYQENGRFIVERWDDDASGRTSGKKTNVLEL